MKEKIILRDKYLDDTINPDIELYRENLVYDVDGKTAFMMAVVEQNKTTGNVYTRSYNMDDDAYFHTENQEDHSDRIPNDILEKLEKLAIKQIWSDYKEIQNALKPCKWCGGTGKWIAIPHKTEVLVGIECTSCHIGTGFQKTEEEAVEYWNKKKEN